MHYLYILKNEDGKNYTGVAKDLKKRLFDHNLGKVKSTKYGCPWNIAHAETFSTLSEAKQRERFFKCTPQGGKLKRKILETAGIPAAKPPRENASNIYTEEALKKAL